MPVKQRKVVNHVAGEDLGPIQSGRAVVDAMVELIEEGVSRVKAAAGVPDIGIRQRLGPSVGELRVDALHSSAEQSLQRIVIRLGVVLLLRNRTPTASSIRPEAVTSQPVFACISDAIR